MRLPSVTLLLLFAALGSACTGPRIALAPELTAAGAQELPVSSERRDSGSLLNGRSAGVLRFGAYAVEWERERTEEHRPEPGRDGSCWTRGAVRFLLRTPGEPPRSVQCEKRMEGTYRLNAKVAFVSVADDVGVQTVHCRLPEGSLSLSDEGAERGWLRGEVQLPGVRLALEPASPPGTWQEPAGFTVREDGRAVAAVHSAYSSSPRAVWLAPALSASTRGAVALVSSALLLVGGVGRSCADLAP